MTCFSIKDKLLLTFAGFLVIITLCAEGKVNQGASFYFSLPQALQGG